MKTMILRILSIFLFLTMLMFPEETLSGASTGLLLWFQTVLPTLLPTMILADYLIRIGADTYLTQFFSYPLSRLFGIKKSGTYAILIGFLCGYPMGAKTTASLLQEQRISHKEAAYLLSFCNQPSPMFIIGYLCLTLLQKVPSSVDVIPAMLISIYGSAMVISILYRLIHRPRQSTVPTAQSFNNNAELFSQKTAESTPLSLLEASMMSSFEVMVKIGGYMMLFSVLECFVIKLPILPNLPKLILMGLVEMTTGSRHIATELSQPWSILLCSFVAAFGGFSGLAQTANVLRDSSLSVSRYFLWKLIQASAAALLLLLYFGGIGIY